MQELLSGVRNEEQFERLATLMSPFPILLASRVHHREAARVANACRLAGVATSTADVLIAALAMAHAASLLTTDDDFKRVAIHCTLRLQPY